MNADEQKLLTGLFERTKQAANVQRDPDAERFIAEQVKAQPAAPYLLAQAVIVQEQALTACNERIQALEAQVAQLQQEAPAQAPSGGGLFGSLFGGSRQTSVPSAGPSGPWGGGSMAPQGGTMPPQAGMAPQGGPMQGGAMQAGPWAAAQQAQPRGGGFLQGALSTAAGVAGGALMFEGIKNMMGGNSLFGGSGSGAAASASGAQQPNAGETVVNNYYNDDNKAAGQDDKSTQTASAADNKDAGNNDPSVSDASYDDPDYDDGDYDPSDDESWA